MWLLVLLFLFLVSVLGVGDFVFLGILHGSFFVFVCVTATVVQSAPERRGDGVFGVMWV